MWVGGCAAEETTKRMTWQIGYFLVGPSPFAVILKSHDSVEKENL